MPRFTEKDRKKLIGETRQRLLDSAAVEFAAVGYEQANINTISKNAGYAKGTIYNYFPSKHALLVALIDETAEIHLTFITEKVDPLPEPVERLRAFFVTGFSFVAQYLPRASVLFNTIHGSDEELKAHIFEVYQPMFRYVAEEIITAGIEQNVFKPVEVQTMATLLMTIYLGTASHHDGNGSTWLEPTGVVDLVLYGLCPAEGEK